MLDVRFVCDNIDYVEKRLATRSGKIDLSNVKKLADERLTLIKSGESKKALKNKVSEEIAIAKRNKQDATDLIAEMKKEAEEIKAIDARLSEVEAELKDAMYAIPNLPDESVPLGDGDQDNVEIRRVGTPRVFDFEPKAHWDIGEQNKGLNFEQGAKLTGARFTVYNGFVARLERAVTNYMLDTHTANGYTEIFPPFIVNEDSMKGTGQLPKFKEDMFKLEGLPYYLVPTAEVPVTNLFRGDILTAEDLPIRYCAYTACFRAEAGSAGRDTRGLIRQHQFNKVELVNFAHPEHSWEALEDLTHEAELILQGLGIPYRVVTLSTGDMGFSSAKTYDIEVWMPSYNRYVEISSCSNFVDYQARRASIRFRDTDKKVKLVHTLNGSGLAVGRTTAAIMENFQNEDGTVTVPEVLRKYMGVDKF